VTERDPGPPPIGGSFATNASWTDLGRALYWQVHGHLVVEDVEAFAVGGPERTPTQRHRLALRAAQVGLLKLARDLEQHEIAKVLGVSVRTVKRANALLRAAINSRRGRKRP
jgi:transcriptional regulator GlxA family with amidase domain